MEESQEKNVESFRKRAEAAEEALQQVIRRFGYWIARDEEVRL